MKIFLDDFIMYSDMENYLQRLRLCFQKCKESGISLNMCIYDIFKDDFGFYYIQRRETIISK
jgi:hypothetical protein